VLVKGGEVQFPAIDQKHRTSPMGRKRKGRGARELRQKKPVEPNRRAFLILVWICKKVILCLSGNHAWLGGKDGIFTQEMLYVVRAVFGL